MDGGGDEQQRRKGLNKEVLDRLKSLENSHVKLQEQVNVLLREKVHTDNNVGSSFKNSRERGMTSDSSGMRSFPGWGYMPGAHFAVSPDKNLLECIGHAIYVTRATSGDFIFWNGAAEKLYGYKEREVHGQHEFELLFEQEHHPLITRITKRLTIGESWSGQLRLKKMSGQIFTAIITKSPLYEDGELNGYVTVSHDASVFNWSNSGNTRTDGHQRRGVNTNKLQWNPQPQLASSISNLAFKVLKRNGNIANEEAQVENQDSKADRPPRAPSTKLAFNFSMGKSRINVMGSRREEFN